MPVTRSRDGYLIGFAARSNGGRCRSCERRDPAYAAAYNLFMRRAALLVSILAIPLFAQPAPPAFDLTGHVAARGASTTGPASWLERGFGKLGTSGDRDDILAVGQVGIDWRPSKHFDVHVSGAARHDPEEFGGEDAGLVEAYADVRAIWGLDELQLRAGQFFLPTSRENKDALWTSPYTINFSALNTWIGEEVRPIGADLEYRHTTDLGHVITTGATAFRGNDTMGTLLAWRGWSQGDRLSTYGEVLPLPPIGSLDTYFFRQRDDGSKPFGPDLDGNTGYSARLRYSVPQRWNIQYTWLDNRGDRALYRGEYAWATKFHLLGFEAGNPDGFKVAAEYMKGTTAMGLFAVHVDAGFHAGYLLVSEKRNRNRWTARYEVFGTSERDFTAAESNEEDGRSWTLTWMFDVTQSVRAAVEVTQLTADRAAAAQYGFDPETDGRVVTAEVRYRF